MSVQNSTNNPDKYSPRRLPKSRLAQALYASRDLRLDILVEPGQRTSALSMKTILMTVASCESGKEPGLRVTESKACTIMGFKTRQAYERNMAALIKAGLITKQRRNNSSSIYRVHLDNLNEAMNLQHYMDWESLDDSETVEETIVERIRRVSKSSGYTHVASGHVDQSSGNVSDAYDDGNADGISDAISDASADAVDDALAVAVSGWSKSYDTSNKNSISEEQTDTSESESEMGYDKIDLSQVMTNCLKPHPRFDEAGELVTCIRCNPEYGAETSESSVSA